MTDSMFDNKCQGCKQLLELAKIVAMLTEEEFNRCVTALGINDMKYNPVIIKEIKDLDLI